jgi:predicted DsbA family dithiol-disulfide isomerase
MKTSKDEGASMIIDLFHDTACPWCRIGKQHLKLALAQWDGEPVTVNYRTFFLNSATPPEGQDFTEFMLAKSNGQLSPEHFFDAPRQAGAAVDLRFNFEAIATFPNTLLSHQLIALSPAAKREQIVEAIYAAYFEHGRDIGQIDEIIDIADRYGLDAAQIRADLQNGTAREQVQSEAQFARQAGISGVPFFIIDGALAFSGAHPPEVILQALQQAAELRQKEPHGS